MIEDDRPADLPGGPGAAGVQGGHVRVMGRGPRRPGTARAGQLAAVAAVAAMTAGLVVVTQRAFAGARSTAAPAGTLDARSLPPGTDVGSGAAVPGAARLVLLGPLPLADTRTAAPVQAGGSVELQTPALPPQTSAVLLEVSVLSATGPGAVTVTGEGGAVTALLVPRAGAQVSAGTVAPVGGAGRLRLQVEGGGHVLVSLLGAFARTASASGGRVRPVPATEVIRLVPATDGKDARGDLSAVPEIREAGTVAAVVLQVAGDVGSTGGFVSAGPARDRLGQSVFWSATSGTDRLRSGLLVVPVEDGSVHVHYEAGTELRASVVGYVTDDTAPVSSAGLVVPIATTGAAGALTTVPAGRTVAVPAIGADAARAVPAGRVDAGLVQVAAQGATPTEVTVSAADASGPVAPTLTAGTGAPRSALTLAGIGNGTMRVSAGADASVALTPLALILAG